MTTLFRSEIMKLHTLRSTYLVGAGMLAMVAIIAAAGLSEAGQEGMMNTSDLRNHVLLSAGMLPAIVLAVMGVSAGAGEYRHGTIGQRLLAVPSRHRLLGVKLVTYGAMGLLAGLLSIGVAIGLTEPLAGAKDLTLDLASAGEFLRSIGGLLAGSVLFAALGVTVGFISRSQAAGIVVVFGTFFAEKILGGVLGKAAEFLPYSLLSSLMGQGGPSRGTAVLSLTAITAITVALAFYLLRKRDVT